MMKRNQTPSGRTTRVAILLGLLVLLPALFYTGFEISTYNQNEGFIREIYRRQLDAILFSVNQHGWDVTSNWANTVTGILDRGGRESTYPVGAELGRFAARSQGLDAIVLLDSAGAVRTTIMRDSGVASEVTANALAHTLASQSDLLSRVALLRRLEYRKLEPVALEGDDGPLALVFSYSGGHESTAYVALLIAADDFIRAVISPKLVDLAGEEFVLAVRKGAIDSAIVSTSALPPGRDLQSKPLWIFPSYNIGVTLKGESVDDIVRLRLRNNLLLVAALALLLLAVAWFGFRNIRAEIALARAKSRLVSNVSHELRTPLALIRMYAETLEMGRLKSESKKQEYYGTILRESERLTHLVNNILDFSRMETGQKRYSFLRIDVNDAVSGVCDMYRPHLQREGVSPIVELFTPLPRIQADRDALEEALINLIDNAVKYGGDEKYLRIGTGFKGGKVFVEVADHGIGIPPALKQKVFEAFYRVDDPVVQNTKGSGIGLSLVKQIMDAHGGSVEFESVPGKGSTFRLQFPSEQG